MFPLSVSIILATSLGLFAYSIWRRFSPLLKAKRINHFNHYPQRLWRLLSIAFAQKKFFKRDIVPGIMHACIFWGFCVLAIRTITLFAMGFSPDFHFPLMNGAFGDLYTFTKDLFTLLVAVAVVVLIYRRVVVKPKRLTISREGTIILGIIFFLMVTDWFFDGAMMAAGLHAPSSANFMGTAVGTLLSSMAIGYMPLVAIGNASYLIHLVLIGGFLNFLPYGKHFHVITFIPNVFFSKQEPGGAIDAINLEDETATSFGVNKAEDFDWKQYLDFYSCTECGRCMAECPATATGKQLNPKQLIIDLRDHVYAVSNDLGNENAARPAIAGDVIKSDVFWACTTCKACETACPIAIEHVDKIIEIRRHKVLMEGDFPAQAQTAMRNIENNSNPWGFSHQDRAKWADGLNVPILAEDANVEYMYFVGCAGSFDERNKKISRAFVKALQHAGITFGILGNEEKCTGDSARRVGNEYLFQMLAKDNIALFAKYNVKKILTTCPHCYNTLKNEYPQFGGHYEVHHHTEFLADLLKSGKLTTQAPKENRSITFHDSCYLGRYNGIYEAPRDILKTLGFDIHEPELHGEFGRCCGAGGARMWMEETEGTRVNQKRLEDLSATGAKTVASSCPFCITMLGDATRETGNSEIVTQDIAEIVADQLS